MLGIVFTEFLELVEERFGLAMTDRILQDPSLSTGGAYTSVGNYPHEEMVGLVTRLHQATGVPVPDLLKLYGEHLFGRLAAAFPQLVAEAKDSLGMFALIDAHIHVQVKKLYPHAELPRFEHEMLDADRMLLRYTSTRRMADLAEGLMMGCAKYFDERIVVQREADADNPDRVLFRIERLHA
jgi:hypothetical protein